MNILVIAPHPDDETIGCGGALCLHAGRGDRIAAVYLTSGELGLKQFPRDRARRIRESEARRAAKILGIAKLFFLRLPDWEVGDHISNAAKKLRPLLKRWKPRWIYLPHPHEWHPDHKACLAILRSAMSGQDPASIELRTYEVWTPHSGYDVVEDISSVMPRKLRALRAHQSQLKEFDYVRAVTGLNQFRGVLAARCRFAEVFQTE